MPKKETPLSTPLKLALGLLLLFTLGLRFYYFNHDLDASRFYDERYGLENVGVFLKGEGKLSAYYPSLSFAPQTAVLWGVEKLHEFTGIESLSVFDPQASDGWSEQTYFLCRLLSALFGVISVWLLFRVGCLFFSPSVGLMAGVFFSAVPRHLLSSSHFKPDILVALFTLLAFLWIRRAALEPTMARFCWAGAGVGLAVAAKYTGVGIAMSVVPAALWGGFRQLKRWRLLFTAGLASVLTFFLLNPHVATIFKYLGRLQRIAESKGEAEGGSHWSVAVDSTLFLVEQHGPWVFVLALAGMVAWLWRFFSTSTSPECRLAEKRDLALLLAYPLGYSALWIFGTTVFRGQNHLPVTAFTSLAAAWMTVLLSEKLVALGILPRPWGQGALLTILSLIALTYPLRLAYEGVVPSTYEVVEDKVARDLSPHHQRLAYYEVGEYTWRLWKDGRRMARKEVPSLLEVPLRNLRQADLVLFLAERLEGPSESAYRELLDQGAMEIVKPVLGEIHGPEIVLWRSPWKLDGPCESLALPSSPKGPEVFRLEYPLKAGQMASISAWIPTYSRATRPRFVVVDGAEVPLLRTRKRGRRSHFLTPRGYFEKPKESLEVSFKPFPDHWPKPPIVELCQWHLEEVD